MPSAIPRNQMLRDDILAQLRSATTPLTTRRLRAAAAPVSIDGFTVRAAPLREHVYRVLQQMRADRLVEPVPTCGRDLAWRLTEHGAAKDEIASLAELFALAPVQSRVSGQHRDQS